MKVAATLSVEKVWPGNVGGAVFTGRIAAGELVRVVASRQVLHRFPNPSETWRVEGIMQHHPRYGEQLHAETAVPVGARGNVLVHWMVRNIPGIGKQRAGALWATFGDELASVLGTGRLDALTEVVDEPLARNLLSVWSERAAETAAIEWLDENGFDVRLANKVLRLWPENAEDKLTENPYRLLLFAPWAKVDQVALDLGVPSEDPLRLIAATEEVAYRRLCQQHTVLTHQDLAGGISRLLLCDRSLAERAVELALEEIAIVRIEPGYQLVGAAQMERLVALRLHALASPTGHQKATADHILGHGDLEPLIDDLEHAQQLPLAGEQRAAVRSGLLDRVAVITGAAGTGKSTVLRAICAACERTGRSFYLMALAGRAAARLREVTGREASTIAAFLRDAGQAKIKLDSNTMVVVDEASMIDLPLVYRLMKVLPDACRLLLVGDPHQLPPISFGLFLHALTSGPFPVTELHTVHRQDETTGIPAVADAVRHGRVPRLPRFAGRGEGLSILPCGSHEILDRLPELVHNLGGPEDVQIVCAIRGGTGTKVGTKDINAFFHQMESSAGRTITIGGATFGAGDPVVYTKNDYERGLWNGSLGCIEAITGDGKVIADFDGERHDLEGLDLENLDLAYALTIHKAQGSSWPKVVVPITPSRFFDRAMVYTALTRGEQAVIFAGDEEVLRRSILREPNRAERQTAFPWWVSQVGVSPASTPDAPTGHQRRGGRDRTREAVFGLLRAMGCECFDIGILDPSREAMKNRYGWNLEQVVKSIPFLKSQNAQGKHIFIRPSADQHDLTLIDDLHKATIAGMSREGFNPAAVVETSPGSFQAWLRHHRVIGPELRTAAANELARMFQGDTNTDHRHYGRLAGFTNRKVKHQRTDGLFPFALLRGRTGKPYPASERFLSELDLQLPRNPEGQERATRYETTPAERRRGYETKPLPKRQPLRTPNDYHEDPRYGGDLHRADMAYAHYAAARGLSVDQIAHCTLRSRDLSHKGGKERQREYAYRTAEKAIKMTSGPPRPVPSYNA